MSYTRRQLLPTDGPAPSAGTPPRGWFGVYRKTSYVPFSATLEASLPNANDAIELAKELSGKMSGRFEVVAPSRYTVFYVGKIEENR